MVGFDSSSLQYLTQVWFYGFSSGFVVYFVAWGTQKLFYTFRQFLRG